MTVTNDMAKALVSIHETGQPCTSDMFVLAAIQKGAYWTCKNEVAGGLALLHKGKWYVSGQGMGYVKRQGQLRSYEDGTYRKRKHNPHAP
jgi:hypothetical protein